MSLEQIHSFCFNRQVTSTSQSPQPLRRQSAAGKIVEFADLRLSTPVAGEPVVLLEYEDAQGTRSMHRVSLTCTGEGRGGLIYFGGYDEGRFTIFRADCIHRVVTL